MVPLGKDRKIWGFGSVEDILVFYSVWIYFLYIRFLNFIINIISEKNKILHENCNTLEGEEEMAVQIGLFKHENSTVLNSEFRL